MHPIKVYVPVRVDFRADGVMIPRSITWEDGQEFEIDKIMDIRQAAAMRAGGQGDRYTIRVKGQQSYLYFERLPTQSGSTVGRWFVERKQA